jgi:CubicO group peptidase (beta-lactamase class C family)
MYRTRSLSLAAATLAAVLPALAPAQTRDPAAIAAALDPRIASAIDGGRIAGTSVAVVRGRDTLLMKTYGRADLERGVPTPDRAVYEIGSISKQFTAAAILQLQERGKLSLDDEVAKHLPGIPTQGRRVTLRHLLGHSSGIAGFHTGDPEFRAIMGQALPLDTLARVYAAKPFDFAPGTAMRYNNTGYLLLGMIVERASGMPYGEYVKRNLFDRAGMRDTRHCGNGDRDPHRVRGYDGDGGALKPSEDFDRRWGTGAGSICSTTADLVAWTRALHGGRILGPAAYREMLSPDALADGTRPRYAKGLILNPVQGHRAIHHGGSIYGFESHLAYLPDDSLTIVVLVNTRTAALDPSGAVEYLVRTILGDASPAPAAFTGRAEEYAGEYHGSGATKGMVLTVAADSTGALTMRSGDGRASRLVYFGGETFGRGDVRYTFVREGGRVARIRVDAGTTIGIATRE